MTVHPSDPTPPVRVELTPEDALDLAGALRFEAEYNPHDTIDVTSLIMRRCPSATWRPFGGNGG